MCTNFSPAEQGGGRKGRGERGGRKGRGERGGRGLSQPYSTV